MTVARRPAGAGPLPIDPGLLRAALDAGRLPLGALRLTILQAVDAELYRRGGTPGERRDHRDRVGRFLADHADRRGLPSGREARRWARELTRRGRMTRGEARACLRSLRLLYAGVLGRPGEGSAVAAPDPPARERAGPRPGRPAARRGPVTGGLRRRRRAGRQ